MEASFDPLTITLRAEQYGNNLGWIIGLIPVDSIKRFGMKVHFNVKAVIEERIFDSTCFPTGTGQHYLMITNEMKNAFGIVPGVSFAVTIEHDPMPRTVEVPESIVNALAAKPELLAIFEKMAPSHRRYWVQQYQQAKAPETRQKRIFTMMEKLEEIRVKKASK